MSAGSLSRRCGVDAAAGAGPGLWEGAVLCLPVLFEPGLLLIMGAHNFPKEVWSPAGGWWADPKGWKKNTILVYAAIFAIAAPVAYYSKSNEIRTQEPRRWIPSMMWSSNMPSKNDS
eukprot:jgi/Tetstr1/443109/TSEL_031165.t1